MHGAPPSLSPPSLSPPCPGGPGSGKGRIVANLRSMFGMKLISGENIVLKYLPKKVQHSMTLTSTEVCPPPPPPTHMHARTHSPSSHRRWQP